MMMKMIFSMFFVIVSVQLCFSYKVEVRSPQEAKLMDVLIRLVKFKYKYCKQELTQEQLRNVEACRENSLTPNIHETCKKVVFGSRHSKNFKKIREGLCFSDPTRRFYKNCVRDIIARKDPDL